MNVSIKPGSNAPAVVYGSGLVRYAEKVGSTWVVEHLEDSQANFGASLDFDSTGRPHVALRRVDGLWHLQKDSGLWNRTFVRGASAPETDFYELGRPIVRIDDTGHPAVLYVKVANTGAVSGGYELELARKN